MLRRLIVTLTLLAAGAALANPTCPDPFPDIGDASMYLVFPVHGLVHTIQITDPSTKPGGNPILLRYEFTRHGRIAAIDAYDPPSARRRYAYRATFDQNGDLAAATFTIDGAKRARIQWRHPRGNVAGYGDLYVRMKSGDPMPGTPNFRIVPNVSIANYGIYQPDGSLVATLEYEQSSDCSLSGLHYQFPGKPTAKPPILSRLFGASFIAEGEEFDSFGFIPSTPDLIAATNPAHPELNYYMTFAWKALSEDDRGNVTRYLMGWPKPHFNQWKLDTSDKSASPWDLAYTYYDGHP